MDKSSTVEFAVPTDSTMFCSRWPGDVHGKMIGAMSYDEVAQAIEVAQTLDDMDQAIKHGWCQPILYGDDYNGQG